jgi:hypothetical protein
VKIGLPPCVTRDLAVFASCDTENIIETFDSDINIVATKDVLAHRSILDFRPCCVVQVELNLALLHRICNRSSLQCTHCIIG